jgi:hypothetical protein
MNRLPTARPHKKCVGDADFRFATGARGDALRDSAFVQVP